MQKFALFDIDGTIIRWQLFHSIVNELISRGKLPEAAESAIKAARMTWKRREHTDSFREYESVLVHSYLDALTSISPVEHTAAIDQVFDEYKDQTYTFTRDLIKKLKADNYLLFAISGSQQGIVEKLANYYGFDAAVGANIEIIGGKFSGKVDTPALGKQKALESLLSSHDITHEGSIAVGDSESDVVLLEAVEQPIAFNPSRGLLEIAQQRGWNVIVERKNVVYELEPRDGSYVLV